MAGSFAASDETIFPSVAPRWPHGPAGVRAHDARTQRQDSVLCPQFPKNPDETQCDMALASSSPAASLPAELVRGDAMMEKTLVRRCRRSPQDLALGHCGLVPLHGLAHFETFELRMVEVER